MQTLIRITQLNLQLKSLNCQKEIILESFNEYPNKQLIWQPAKLSLQQLPELPNKIIIKYI